MRQALELALEFIERVNKDGWILADFEPEMHNTITAIKEALAQPQQEPQIAFNAEVIGYVAPQRTWVGLHTTTILDIYTEVLKTHRGGSMPDGQIAFAKAIEQALKERNT